jgi:hypothetical protein
MVLERIEQVVRVAHIVQATVLECIAQAMVLEYIAQVELVLYTEQAMVLGHIGQVPKRTGQVPKRIGQAKVLGYIELAPKHIALALEHTKLVQQAKYTVQVESPKHIEQAMELSQ